MFIVWFDKEKIRRVADVGNLIKGIEHMPILGKGWHKMFIAKVNDCCEIMLGKHVLENNFSDCSFNFTADKIHAALFTFHSINKTIAQEKKQQLAGLIQPETRDVLKVFLIAG